MTKQESGWKPLKVPSSYSVPFCLHREMKILNERRSSSMAGMFSIARDSFSASQNFFHAFITNRSKSCTECFLISALAKISQFRLRFCSAVLLAGLKFIGTVCLFPLLASSWRSTDSSIMNRNKPVFSYSFSVTFLRTTSVTTRSA